MIEYFPVLLRQKIQCNLLIRWNRNFHANGISFSVYICDEMFKIISENDPYYVLHHIAGNINDLFFFCAHVVLVFMVYMIGLFFVFIPSVTAIPNDCSILPSHFFRFHFLYCYLYLYILITYCVKKICFSLLPFLRFFLLFSCLSVFLLNFFYCFDFCLHSAVY